MAVSKLELLHSLSFGQRVAEDEVDQLASYFVETEQWRKVASGEVDIVFGAKGAGKSAIYSTLIHREGQFFDLGITLIAAESLRGAPAFKDLVSDPPTSEREFIGLWKLYILSLIGTFLAEYGVAGDASNQVRGMLYQEGLLPSGDAPLRTRLRVILDYVKRAVRIEGQVGIDPATGTPAAIAGKISLEEPSGSQSSNGIISVDKLLSLANRALSGEVTTAWILFDRLDVAFADSRELEGNALRALFKCYLDFLVYSRIKLKIFLRTDIWRSITSHGFREASHITRQMTISWGNSSLLNLVSRRLSQSPNVISYYGYDADSLTATQQRRLFDSMVPDQIDAGKNPKTFEWTLGRVTDGNGVVAPREVIHLLNAARDAQVGMLERGEEEPPGKELLSRQAFREALQPVSKVRLEQTVYAEYPELRNNIMMLEQEKTEHAPASLARIWKVDEPVARSKANELVEIGFFEQRGEKGDPRFWVPFLYRPALQMVQGSAV